MPKQIPDNNKPRMNSENYKQLRIKGINYSQYRAGLRKEESEKRQEESEAKS